MQSALLTLWGAVLFVPALSAAPIFDCSRRIKLHGAPQTDRLCGFSLILSGLTRLKGMNIYLKGHSSASTYPATKSRFLKKHLRAASTIKTPPSAKTAGLSFFIGSFLSHAHSAALTAGMHTGRCIRLYCRGRTSHMRQADPRAAPAPGRKRLAVACEM